MAGHNIDDDEYVANLLKQDAQNSTKQYKMVGLDAFLPSRSRSGAPKPNTRFLRHIIRETDSHNSALLAKEAEESRARLRQLSREKELRQRNTGRLTPPNDVDYEQDRRKRKRSRHEDRREDRREDRHARQRRAKSDDDGRGDRSRRNKDRNSERRREKTRYDYGDSEEDLGSRAKRSPEERDPAKRRRRSRSGSRGPERRKLHREHGDNRHKHRGSHRSYSRAGDRSPSPPPSGEHKSSRHRREPYSGHRSREHGEGGSSSQLATKHQLHDSDSDPLEAIVGPLPPPPAPAVRTRGRGAHKVSSMAMDARFSSTYNPSTDVHMQSDADDDWGDALEALKDRQRWNQQGAERLKAAGFSDEQVRRWEKGDEKTEEDVRWALKGEAREWDRGKVLDDDGDVDLKAEWGRLT